MPFKKYLRLLAPLLFFFPVVAHASHIYGGDFSYTWLSGITYKLTLTVYGDCSGASFPNLPGASPEIKVYDDATGLLYQTVNLSNTAPTTGVEVTPVCAADQALTSCTVPGSTIPGVKRFIYIANITLLHTSPSWRFRFDGNMGGGTQAGRSNSIGNILFANNASLMNLEATLNNSTGHNSSPQFTTIPTPFYCNNIAQQYNQGAVDPDNDSLGYALAPALDQAGPVTYQSGYSATNPVHTSVPMTLNGITGQIAFTPDVVQRSVVVNKVYEYRSGVLVGSAMREMTFIILPTCSSSPPTGPLDTAAATITGGVALSATEFVTCYGTANNIHFNIKPVDPDGDTVDVSLNGLPAGATATITNNGTPTPTVAIDWNVAGLTPGNYNFFATYKDHGCPLSNQQTIAYTLHVVRANELSSAPVLAPTQCVHRAVIRYNTIYGLLPRTISVLHNGAIIHSLTDATGSTVDSLYAGTYTIKISSPALTCVSQYTLTVVDSGVYPYKPVVAPVYYCLNDAPVALTAVADSGAALNWHDASGNYLQGTPVPSTATAGIFNYLVSQRYLVCESLEDTERVFVTKRPVASISAPASICTKDTATIVFNGSIGVGPIIGYSWSFDNPAYDTGSGAGPYRLSWATTGVKKILLQVFENQCPSAPDTISLTVKPTPHSVFVAPEQACQLDTFVLHYPIAGIPGEQYTWGFGGAAVLSGAGGGPYSITFTSAGVKHFTQLINFEGCTDTSSRDIIIHPTPDIRIGNTDGSVCVGDKIFLTATGGAAYSWAPADRVFNDVADSTFTRVLVPTTYTVYGRSEYGCTDSAKITFSDVKPCCMFSYPTAFSPNKDGHNDSYHIKTYGNDLTFQLSIYDRWGHRVFYSADPAMGWDGTYGGKACENGTYFYYMKARCYTGHDEERRGDLELLR